MAEEKLFSDLQITSREIEIHKIGMQDIWRSLKEGYDDFNAKPTYVFFLILTYPLFALTLTLLMVGEGLLYLTFPIFAGFTLLGPAFSVALFEMSRRRELGLELKWRLAFNFVHSSAFAPIVALSVVMMLLYAAWLYLAQFMYFGLFTIDPPASVAAFANELTTTKRGAALVVYGTGIGFLFAFTTLATSVIGFPLLLDRPATAATAIATSFRAVTANPLVMAVWGLVVVALLVAGAMLFLVGLAAVLPILGHSTWHLYRKVVEADPVDN
jgi:uncharacterized membrane protein